MLKVVIYATIKIVSHKSSQVILGEHYDKKYRRKKDRFRHSMVIQ